MQASLETGKPLLFGVLTCTTLAQARARALPPDLGGKQDKGREVARAAVETLAALKSVTAPRQATRRRASRKASRKAS